MTIARLAFTLLLPLPLAAQHPAIDSLKPENGRIDSVYQTFSVRELLDGRLLVPGRAGTMQAVNFGTHQVEALPNVRASTRVIALPGDSTVVVIPGTAGWIFLQGTRLLGMLPASNPVVDSVQQLIGVDDSGNAIGVVHGIAAADSDRLVRVGRRSGTVDVIGRLWAPGLPPGVPAPAFMVFETAAVAPDGWIAVVRSHPYRVDWRSAPGGWIHGAPIDTSPTPMNRREQEAYLARQLYAPPTSHFDWPAVVEPFTAPEPKITPDGMVVVKRTPTADLPGTRYDVIDRRGVRVRTVQVGDNPNDMIVGFGEHAVYLWMADSKHGALGHIERHPWP